jgi:hypothetical protein
MRKKPPARRRRMMIAKTITPLMLFFSGDGITGAVFGD